MTYGRITELMRGELERIKKCNIKVRELAREIDLSPASLYNYAYNDVIPRDENIRKIAGYFRVTPAYLRGEDNSAADTQYPAAEEKKKSPASDIFEDTMANRPAEEQLELLTIFIRLVREHDGKKAHADTRLTL